MESILLILVIGPIGGIAFGIQSPLASLLTQELEIKDPALRRGLILLITILMCI